MPPIFAPRGPVSPRSHARAPSLPSFLDLPKFRKTGTSREEATDFASLFRFEKSLYDLIRGLRQHKGNEKAFIQDSLKECRKEVRNMDGDVKATAILKLIYLDMVGYDMGWAAFHVLEVMSSSKFVQKRIGYLGAVQSFRLDTDVLMLTTNQIKKDLSSSSIYDVSTAINGLSHIVSPSLARDLSPDLLTKMSHHNPYIRKKAVLVMYKLFLQSPELLRTSWPKLKDMLNDSDPSVLSAVVNVICELAKKNPRNYLPLAPQLFKLLTTNTNNWMTIKIIKLFATLTPLEPRLIKKLIPPITDLIRTTPAMSVLYECINGLIQGGLLAGIAETREGEELGRVCVDKLRGFLVEGDANLKYVGLLAFAKLVKTHAHLVAEHQDVILECIDDPDISIRLRALELVGGMVSVDNLPSVVGKLIRQLKPISNSTESSRPPSPQPGDYDDLEDMEQEIHPDQRPEDVDIVLPDTYKLGVIKRILDMCSHDMYANIEDFEWYLDVLAQLIRYAPPVGLKEVEGEEEDEEETTDPEDVGEEIGRELRNVAVRVKSVREEATNLAALFLSRKDGIFPAAGGGGRRVLYAAGWIVGEYASLLEDAQSTLDALIHPQTLTLPYDILSIYLQALPKVYAALTSPYDIPWTPTRKTQTTFLTKRILDFLMPCSKHPSLEVQERAVEFLELFKLTSEAIAEHNPAETSEPPLLLTQVIPSLFQGQELNPVAPRAQRKVPLPQGLDLDVAINPNLALLLSAKILDTALTPEEKSDHDAYFVRPKHVTKHTTHLSASELLSPASSRLPSQAALGPQGGYQSSSPLGTPKESTYLDADIAARRAKRRERNKDDPFYIKTADDSDVDIDSIPVMQLDLSGVDLSKISKPAPKKKKKERVVVVADEGLDGDEVVIDAAEEKRKRRNILKRETGLAGVSLDEDKGSEDERRAKEEVERIRKEIEGVKKRQGLSAYVPVPSPAPPEEAAKVKKKKKKVVEGEEGVKKKKKKKVVKEGEEGAEKKKRKKKKPEGEAAVGVEAE